MLENNRDRGTKKWAMAMMLPEHVVKLRNWMDEDHYEERPILNEWDLQNIQEGLEIAFTRKCESMVTTWENGKIMRRGGVITEINVKLMHIVLDSPFGIDRISVNDIVGVQCVD